jgi:hypothetical protein
MIAKRAVLASAVAGLLCFPAVADATPPEHFSIDISETVLVEELTEACGTEVSISISGTRQVTLWRNEAGLVIRQLDRAPGAKLTYSAPETGASVSHPYSVVSTWDYGGGATVGSQVTVTLHGLFGHVTGFVPSSAGTATGSGFVSGFDDFGIPQVDDLAVLEDPIRETGNREPIEDVLAALCEALTAG